MKSAFTLWANLEAARDDSSINLVNFHVRTLQIPDARFRLRLGVSPDDYLAALANLVEAAVQQQHE